MEQLKILAKLQKIQNEIAPVKKTGTNPHFKSSYIELAPLLDAVLPVLNKHNVLLSQTVEGDELFTSLIDSESGEFINSRIELLLDSGRGMQGLGSAITYARRYSIVAMLNIKDEDDDGNAASAPQSGNNAPAEQAPKQDVKEFEVAGQKYRRKYVDKVGKYVIEVVGTKNDKGYPVSYWQGSDEYQTIIDIAKSAHEGEDINPDDLPF